VFPVNSSPSVLFSCFLQFGQFVLQLADLRLVLFKLFLSICNFELSCLKQVFKLQFLIERLADLTLLVLPLQHGLHQVVQVFDLLPQLDVDGCQLLDLLIFVRFLDFLGHGNNDSTFGFRRVHNLLFRGIALH
jgi:hypothetical protein